MTYMNSGAWLSLVTSLVVLAGVAIPVWRELRKNSKATDEIHKIVNQQRTDMQSYQEDLLIALRNAGVEVPRDKSLDAG